MGKKKKAMTHKEVIFFPLLRLMLFNDPLGKEWSFLPNVLCVHVIELKSREFEDLIEDMAAILLHN